MKLLVLGSSSSGNGYVLTNDKEALVIEVGVPFHVAQKALDFNTGIIKGCLLTHCHKDHSKFIFKYIERGINVFASAETVEAVGSLGSLKPVAIASKQAFSIGNFKIVSFPVIHDVPTIGFHIYHPETGNIVFMTDTAYSPLTFKNISHFIIEANYITEIVQDAINSGRIEQFRLNRLVATHMSLNTCKELLKANDLSITRNIILIHLSDSNSDAKRMKREINEQFKIPTFIAEPGLKLKLENYDEPIF